MDEFILMKIKKTDAKSYMINEKHKARVHLDFTFTIVGPDEDGVDQITEELHRALAMISQTFNLTVARSLDLEQDPNPEIMDDILKIKIPMSPR